MIIDDVTQRAALTRTTRWHRLLPSFAAVGGDLVVMTLVILAAGLGRARLPIFNETGDVDNLVAAAAIPLAVGWVVFLAVHGAYAPHVMGAGTAEYKAVVRGTLVAAGATGIVSFLWKLEFSRGFFFLLIIVGVPALVLGRHLVRRAVHGLRRRGHLTLAVLVAGSPAQVDEITGVLERESWLGYRVLGAVVPSGERVERTPGGVPVIGTTLATAAVAEETECDIVLFAGGAVTSAQEMRRVAWQLTDSGTQIMVVPSLTDVASDRVRVRPAAGLQLMELEGARAQAATRVSKRLFDLVGASAIIVLLSPVLLVTALAIKLHDGGPVFFRQRRVGRDGETFECWKFRSMVVDADRLLHTVAATNGHGVDHVLFKAADDPRITKPGRWIRRFSLDELPQLVNVVRGEMSLVGPRPPLPEEVDRYSDDMRRRLLVRPGMTGLWQVSGRSDLSWDDAVRLDLYYVDNWSLVQDLAILAKTMSAVVSARGAY
ncbi:MAG TPA: sugar transferase [Phycicoccus sp.]|nr:sugar transferase [Phycicoccus sp.]